MKTLLLAVLIFMTTSTYAYFCSSQKGHGYINLGDSIQQVQGACGIPDNVSTKSTGGSKMVSVQHWIYTHKPVEARFGSSSPHADVELPPDVTFQVIDNKVTAIASQGKAMQSSNLCRTGMQVTVGQTAQSVMDSCGRPDFVDSRQQLMNQPEQKITVWTYSVPSGSPIVLEFTNGQLSKIN